MFFTEESLDYSLYINCTDWNSSGHQAMYLLVAWLYSFSITAHTPFT